MDVSDFPSTGPEPLTGRFLGALDEPGVRGEVLDCGEPADVVNLVEDGEGEDLADAGNTPEQMEAVGIVLLRGSDEIELEVVDDLVVVGDELEVDGDASARGGIIKMLGQTDAIGLVDDLPRRFG